MISPCPKPSNGWSCAFGKALLSFWRAFFIFGSFAPYQIDTLASGSVISVCTDGCHMIILFQQGDHLLELFPAHHVAGNQDDLCGILRSKLLCVHTCSSRAASCMVPSSTLNFSIDFFPRINRYPGVYFEPASASAFASCGE